MTQPKFGGRPKSLVISSPAVTIDRIKRATPIDDPELINDLTGDSRYEQILGGKEYQAIEVVTNDLTYWRTLKKGTICTTVVLTFDGALASDGTKHTNGTSTRTLSNAVQMNKIAPPIEAGGKPAEITYLFLAAKTVAGADPTFSDAVFTG
jgi:hypothetical protein